MPDAVSQETLKLTLSDLTKHGKKSQLVDMYYTVSSELQDQLASETVAEATVDDELL